MPAGKGQEKAPSNNSTPGQRATFRPPWVKDGPSPLPVPEAAWNPKNTRRDSNTNSETKSDNPLANVQLRKTSLPNKETQENGTKESTFVKPALKPVPPKAETAAKPPKEGKFNVKLNSVAERIKKEPPRPVLERTSTLVEGEIDREVPAYRNKLVREESMRRLSATPKAPPMPPMPPPPPPPPDFKRDPLNREQIEKIETLRSRPKVRPDWTEMLKEIEGNKKLKHVICNDRSSPVLPEEKATEHFLYESEKATAHNELLKQIQFGINLKKVKTNDRSKPQLEGLRKFRRQMTIEEQILKSVSMASMPPEEIADEQDEMDDIDKVRDDLQSTKQMLAFELRNKEAQIRENKRLASKLQQMEEELEKLRTQNREAPVAAGGDEQSKKMIKSLQTESDKARKTAGELEKKYHQASDQLENTKSELVDVKKQKEELEKRLQEYLTGKRSSTSDKKDMANGNESDEEAEESSSSDESDDEDDEEKKEKKLEKQIKQIKNKLRNFKNKADNAKKERVALREIIKKHHNAMKEEKKRYKVLQKEVNKMAALMKDVGSDEDEDEEEVEDAEDKEEAEEESEEESSEESETESEDESGSERSQSEPEDAPSVKKKENYATRATRHENILAAIKKGNYLLKTNAERLQDDLNKQKELTATLQEDLDSVLSELG